MEILCKDTISVEFWVNHPKETLQKLRLFTKFPHWEIKPNFGNLCSACLALQLRETFSKKAQTTIFRCIQFLLQKQIKNAINYFLLKNDIVDGKHQGIILDHADCILLHFITAHKNVILKLLQFQRNMPCVFHTKRAYCFIFTQFVLPIILGTVAKGFTFSLNPKVNIMFVSYHFN